MLDIIGLGPAEQRIYEILVAVNGMTTGELEAASGLPPGRLRVVLSALRGKGVIVRRTGTPARYAAMAPEVALGVLFAQAEQRLKQAKLVAEQLNEAYRQAERNRHPADLVEVVHGAATIALRADQIMRSARYRVRFIDKPPYAELQRALHPVEAELLGRGVEVQGIYDRAGLELHDLHADLEAGVRLGEQARVVVNAPTKLILSDDSLALIPLRATPTVMESAVVVRPSALLQALSALFANLWLASVPLALATGPVPTAETGVPSEHDKRLLALLTTGMPDRSIAKQLGLSYRTFQRRLRELMATLGADTRFQAGLRAAARGWVSLPDPQPPAGSLTNP